MYAWTNIPVIMLEVNLGIHQWMIENDECSLMMWLLGIVQGCRLCHVPFKATFEIYGGKEEADLTLA